MKPLTILLAIASIVTIMIEYHNNRKPCYGPLLGIAALCSSG